MNSLVSVIVPCYNQAQYLGEALQSVLEQTYTHWECIIVNDGSPDDTHEVAQEWLAKDIRFKYIKKENGGLSSARNAGIDVAVGEWIQFLDCDDILECNKLKNQSNYFDKNIEVLISGYRYFENNEGISKLRIVGRENFVPETVINYYDEVDVKNLFKIKNPFVICAPLFKADVFKIVGNFDEHLHSLEDWDFNLRCALNNMVFHHTGYDQDSKVLIRLHDTSMMRNKEKMVAIQNKLKEKWNNDELYKIYFGVSILDANNSSKVKSIKKFGKLFIPPILFYLKNKIFAK